MATVFTSVCKCPQLEKERKKEKHYFVEELTLPSNQKIRHDCGVMICDYHIRTIEPFGLMHQHVTSVIVHIIGDHETRGNSFFAVVQRLYQLRSFRSWGCAQVQNLPFTIPN